MPRGSGVAWGLSLGACPQHGSLQVSLPALALPSLGAGPLLTVEGIFLLLFPSLLPLLHLSCSLFLEFQMGAYGASRTHSIFLLSCLIIFIFLSLSSEFGGNCSHWSSKWLIWILAASKPLFGLHYIEIFWWSYLLFLLKVLSDFGAFCFIDAIFVLFSLALFCFILEQS